MFGKIGKFYSDWHELIGQLTQREIKARYKQSILGYAWVILVPIIRLAVLSVVFSMFFRINTGNIPYPLFLFAALVPWMFTANAISTATSSLIANSSLITKVKMPRVIFPLTSVLVKLVDFGLSFLVLLLLIPLMGLSYKATLMFLPIVFIVQLALILGVSLILSALNVFYRDVENLLELFLMVWMYLTPVIYPPEFIPENIRSWFNLNPMMGIVNAYRNVILYGEYPPLESFGFAAVISGILLMIGYKYFRKRSDYFADVI